MVRTAAAAALDADVAQLKTDLQAYLALKQPGTDDPARLFLQWLTEQLRTSHPRMAQAIQTAANQYDWKLAGKTLVDADPFA